MTIYDELEKQKLAAEAHAQGRQPWELEAERAAPTSLIRDLVADAYRGISQTASMIPQSKRANEPPRAPVSAEVPIGPPSGVNYCDAIAESFARRDLAVTHQQRMELEWIEGLLADRKNPRRVRMEYDPLKRFDNEMPAAHRDKGE
jgi:hypothetical protein